jgi:hypothetical protein
MGNLVPFQPHLVMVKTRIFELHIRMKDVYECYKVNGWAELDQGPYQGGV